MIYTRLLCLLHWQVDSLPLSHLGRPTSVVFLPKMYNLNLIMKKHQINQTLGIFGKINCLYPLKMLTKGKVPIMYASNAKQMAAKFLAGGDNPEAC